MTAAYSRDRAEGAYGSRAGHRIARNHGSRAERSGGRAMSEKDVTPRWPSLTRRRTLRGCGERRIPPLAMTGAASPVKRRPQNGRPNRRPGYGDESSGARAGLAVAPRLPGRAAASGYRRVAPRRRAGRPGGANATKRRPGCDKGEETGEGGGGGEASGGCAHFSLSPIAANPGARPDLSMVAVGHLRSRREAPLTGPGWAGHFRQRGQVSPFFCPCLLRRPGLRTTAKSFRRPELSPNQEKR